MPIAGQVAIIGGESELETTGSPPHLVANALLMAGDITQPVTNVLMFILLHPTRCHTLV